MINIAREEIAYYGADADLQNILAVLIGHRAIPKLCANLAALGVHELSDMVIAELVKEGLTKEEAGRIVAAFGLAKKLGSGRKAQTPIIRSPEDAAIYLMDEMRHLKQEHFVTVDLDTKNKILAHQTIFIGSLNGAMIHPREIFRPAIKHGSASIICAHNHPSGDPAPSKEDVGTTKWLMEVGEKLEIEILDHIIIGDGRFYSLKEHGLV